MTTDGASPEDYRGDSKYSGRYLITKLRHRIMGNSYRQVLHCIKDSVVTNHTENISNISDEESNIILTYDLYKR